MKKLLYILIALFCIEPMLYASYSKERKSRRSRQRRSGQTTRTISCQECCRQGRWASCPSYCNNCQQYNDAAAAEHRDYP